MGIIQQECLSSIIQFGKKKIQKKFTKEFVFSFMNDLFKINECKNITYINKYHSEHNIEKILSKFFSFLSRYNKKCSRYCDMKLHDLITIERNLSFRINGNLVSFIFSEHIPQITEYRMCGSSSVTVKIKIVGLDCEALSKVLSNITKKVFENNLSIQPNKIYARAAYEDFYALEFNKKEAIDNIISPEKDSIINGIKNFLNNKDFYEKYNLVYKYNLLLHGEPGTGKTSLIYAISNYFKLPLFIFNKSSDFEIISDGSISSIIGNRPAIVVLEEIDLFFKKDDKNIQITGQGAMVGNVYSLEDKQELLLQFLDGYLSRSNIITIMTTNHIDKLDERFIRFGRVDRIIEMSSLTKQYAIDFCKRFNIGNIEEILSKSSAKYIETDGEPRWNPAQLEREIVHQICQKT